MEKYIGSGAKDRYVYVWDRATGQNIAPNWIYHQSSVNSLSWNADSTRLATGSHDQNIIVWSVADQATRVEARGAHRGGVNVVEWLDGNTLLSAGQDCTVKSWTV